MSARIAVERADLDFRDGAISAAELLETALGSIDVLTVAGDDRALGRAWLAVSIVHQWACRYADAAEAARTASKSYVRASFSPALIDADAHVQPALRADSRPGSDRRRRMSCAKRHRTG